MRTSWWWALAAAALAVCATGCSRTCDAESCADGCCDDSDVCWVNGSGSGEEHCGTGGAACQECGYDQDCVSATCCGNEGFDCTSQAECCPGTICYQESYAIAKECHTCKQAGATCVPGAGDCCPEGNVQCWRISGEYKCACGASGYQCDVGTDCCPGLSCLYDAGAGSKACK